MTRARRPGIMYMASQTNPEPVISFCLSEWLCFSLSLSLSLSLSFSFSLLRSPTDNYKTLLLVFSDKYFRIDQHVERSIIISFFKRASQRFECNGSFLVLCILRYDYPESKQTFLQLRVHPKKKKKKKKKEKKRKKTFGSCNRFSLSLSLSLSWICFSLLWIRRTSQVSLLYIPLLYIACVCLRMRILFRSEKPEVSFNVRNGSAISLHRFWIGYVKNKYKIKVLYILAHITQTCSNAISLEIASPN